MYERQTIVNTTNPNTPVKSRMSNVGRARETHKRKTKRAFSDADTFTQERSDLPKVAPFFRA